MELMEAGVVEALIVKDMSHLGREHLQIGQYTELISPSSSVRFIAVNDGVGSLYKSTDGFTLFRSIMNEFYAKDCIKNGRSVVRLKSEIGAKIASRPQFGYQKDPADPKRHIIPDEEPDSFFIFHITCDSQPRSRLHKCPVSNLEPGQRIKGLFSALYFLRQSYSNLNTMNKPRLFMIPAEGTYRIDNVVVSYMNVLNLHGHPPHQNSSSSCATASWSIFSNRWM